MNNDWRLFREQDKYLYGVTLIQQDYHPSDSKNDHDHCEFCMEKFGKGTDDLKSGYSTLDNSIWICPKCYEDFKNNFLWKVIPFCEEK
jgi:ribosomal protein L37AE/L43A